MGKNWDKAVPKMEIWKECLRVLKPGAFCLVMSAPRQDVLSRMIVNLGDAGFRTDFTSIYWTFASGFPKSANISKLVDKRNGRTQETYKPFAEYLKKKRKEKGLSKSEIDEILKTKTAYSWWEGRASGVQLPSKVFYVKLKTILDLDGRFDKLIEREEAEREVLKRRKQGVGGNGIYGKYSGDADITISATSQAKALNGSYAGFQPKPAVEVVIVCMKPLEEKSYVDQAMKNGKGVAWFDDCKIPIGSDTKSWRKGKYITKNAIFGNDTGNGYRKDLPSGRFPANLLVGDDSLNDGEDKRSGGVYKCNHKTNFIFNNKTDWSKDKKMYDDFGSYSRYFDLDAWYAQFLIVPKASKSEKNKGLERLEKKSRKLWNGSEGHKGVGDYKPDGSPRADTKHKNNHPTVKPVKLFCYLITMFSRAGDLVLDPFLGSGTTLVAAEKTKRKVIGIDSNEQENSCEIAVGRYKGQEKELAL